MGEIGDVRLGLGALLCASRLGGWGDLLGEAPATKIDTGDCAFALLEYAILEIDSGDCAAVAEVLVTIVGGVWDYIIHIIYPLAVFPTFDSERCYSAIPLIGFAAVEIKSIYTDIFKDLGVAICTILIKCANC